MGFLNLFKKTEASIKVNKKCGICKKDITYIFQPKDRNQESLLLSHSNIIQIWVCSNCGLLRHVRCASERKHKVLSEKGLLENQPDMFEMAELFKKGDTRYIQGLECPHCNSYAHSTAYSTLDDKPISIK